jgi:GNAT superfamily N-acetyltransferase
MGQVRLELCEDPDPRDVAALEDGLYEYNRDRTGLTDGRAVAAFLRDEDGGLLGGAFGYTWGGCLEVKYLWVSAALRQGGHGSRLMRSLEQDAIRQGCHTSMLDTYEFQAPQFYRKLGYVLYGEIDDPQTRARKYFFKRSLLTDPPLSPTAPSAPA